MSHAITALLTKSAAPNFADLTAKLQLCIAEALPTSAEAPAEYARIMTDIVGSVEAIRGQINRALSHLLSSPATAALKLSEAEMKQWIASMEEKERISILPDVSHAEYAEFIANVEACLSTWKSWGWKVPDFYCDANYDELLRDITASVSTPRAPLTINNMLYWLLVQWLKAQPSRAEIVNFADIFARTYFYRLVDEHKISPKMIAAIKQTFADIGDLIRVIPADVDFVAEIEAAILRYVVYSVNDMIDSDDAPINFVGIAGLEKVWNEAFPRTSLVLHNVISKKACALYLVRVQKAFEDLLVETDVDKLNVVLLYTMRTALKTMWAFDRNQYLIRLFGMFRHHWRALLEKCCAGKMWAEKIVMLDENWLFYNEMKEAVAGCSAMVKQSLGGLSFFQEFERDCLEGSTEWKSTAVRTVALAGLFEEWNEHPIMRRYMKRFMRFYIGEVFELLLHAKRGSALEGEFEKIVGVRNDLSAIEGHERWIEPLDVFINSLSHYIYQAGEKRSALSGTIDGAVGLVGDVSKTIQKHILGSVMRK